MQGVNWIGLLIRDIIASENAIMTKVDPLPHPESPC